MRAAMAITLMLGLSACGGVAMRDGGVATYDALRAAQAQCAAKGGTLKVKRNGDPKYLDDYACERK